METLYIFIRNNWTWTLKPSIKVKSANLYTQGGKKWFSQVHWNAVEALKIINKDVDLHLHENIPNANYCFVRLTSVTKNENYFVLIAKLTGWKICLIGNIQETREVILWWNFNAPQSETWTNSVSSFFVRSVASVSNDVFKSFQHFWRYTIIFNHSAPSRTVNRGFQ